MLDGAWNHSSSETGSIMIAASGQLVTQTAQPMHLSRPTSDLPGRFSGDTPHGQANGIRFGPSEMASTGHRLMQAPHAVHFYSSITAR